MAVKADFREAESDMVSIQDCLWGQQRSWRSLQRSPGVCEVLMAITVLFFDIASAPLRSLLLKNKN